MDPGARKEKTDVPTMTKSRTASRRTAPGRKPAPSKNGQGVHKIAPQTEAARKLRQEVLDKADRHQVQVVNMWFTDILGQLKSFVVPRHQLEEALEEGLGFDGSSVEGFSRIYESDLLAVPDPSTFAILPFQVDGQVAARFICDIHHPSGAPYQGDPRWVLKKNLATLTRAGQTFYTGPELEFFYVKAPHDPTTLDDAGYFDMVDDDLGTELRQRTMAALASMGIVVECGHHEVAPSQHEIDLRYCDALKMADQVMTYRYLVREIARRHGVHATFMPKPIFGTNGSGMHVHQSVFEGGSNLFYEKGAPYSLSKFARAYTAGVLRHARELVSVTNQWINSYKRLVPGYEAPAYLAWGQKNRSALIRVPMYKPGAEKATRIEVRFPDPAANPYLAFAVLLAAGMAGVNGKYELGPAFEEDVFHLSSDERKKHRIEELPGSLDEALRLTEKSAMVRECLGDHVFSKFIENKRIECDQFRIQVTKYELDRYLPML
jgi:glutamine synthetase